MVTHEDWGSISCYKFLGFELVDFRASLNKSPLVQINFAESFYIATPRFMLFFPWSDLISKWHRLDIQWPKENES